MKKTLLIKRLFHIFLLSCVCLSYSEKAFAEKDIVVTNEFKQFTSYNLQQYLKPFFTSLGQSLNSNLYTRANYQEQWNFAFDICGMGMFIPDAQKTYDAELPEQFDDYEYAEISELRDGVIRKNFGTKSQQPTIYGGDATAVFAAAKVHNSSHSYMVNGVEYIIPDTTMLKTVAFVEGEGINFMSGLPVAQLIVGTPTQTEIRLRYLFAPIKGENLNYFGIILNQRIDHWFHWFDNDPYVGVAVNLGFHNMHRSNGIDITSFNVGAHISKGWNNGFTVYGGLQYEDLSGEISLAREALEPGEQIDSPYKEIRFAQPIKVNIETFTHFRFTAGISYKLSFLEFHADASIASQPLLSAGLSFWLAEIGKDNTKSPVKRRITE
jgi:hypothetical protein